VLVYNLDANDALIDRIPDNILGKTNFWLNTASATQSSLHSPQGLAFDDANNRLFVAQAFTTTVSRVTVYDVTSITDGEDAVSVLGQSTFTAIAPATTQEGLNFPTDLAYDSVNERLFVVQGTANRVSVFNLADGLNDGEAAANVLGQASFTTATAATTQAGMNVPFGLAYDSANQRLFVSEGTSNRVTAFDVASITNGENATGVLGQANFTAITAATTQAGMNVPRGLTHDSANQRLYVAQSTGNRVTTYDVATITNGENAVNVLGQATFTATTAANTQAGMSAPSGVLLVSAQNRLYVGQTGNHRVTAYDVATITDGENAVDALGQYDDDLSTPGPIYTKATANNGPFKLGLNAPNGVAYDATNKRLFVADTTNNRVLVYNFTGDDAPADRIPDYVLGQANFYSNAVATTQTGLSAPTGIDYDSAGNRLFVADLTNSRIIVYDVAAITNGEGAVNVLGQVNFTTATAATTQLGLSSPRQIDFDPASNQLFVADTGNNRVMVFDVTTIVDGENATVNLGQDDGLVGSPSPIFIKGTAQNAAHKLGFNGINTGVAMDPTGHKLFLSDTTNNRVLVYDLDVDNTLTDRVPDSVLGQTNFYRAAAATTQAGMNVPYGLAFDDANDRLFVAQGTGNRVAVFDVASITNGEDAVNVLGQATFTATTAATTQVGMSLPIDVTYDSANQRLFVAENTSHRVKVYSFASSPAPGMNADNAVGQTDSSLSAPLPIYTKTTAHNGPNPLGLSTPTIGMALDSVGNRLFLSDTTNNRILVYNLNTDDSLIDRIPDNVLGQTNFHLNAAGATQVGLETPNGLALSGSTTLFVAEGAGSRVKVYDVTSITNGEDAINVLGQTLFTGTTAATSQGGMSAPIDVVYDEIHDRLFVADSTLNRVTTYDLSNGITNGENAVNVLGQANFTSSTAATTQTGMNVPFGLAYDSANQRLFVSEGTGNRVKVYDVAAITDNENAVNVLGQATFTATTAATTQAGMNAPRGLAYDSANTRLYVAQATGNRVTTYDVAAITDGENAVNVLGQATFTATTAANTQAGMSAPSGVLLVPAQNRLYVGQTGNHRVTAYDVATITDGENAVDALGQYDDDLSTPGPIYTKSVANNGPSKLGLSAPVLGLALDPTDHRLFLSDTGNNRVLVYNLDSNDLLLDLLPDNVLGQTNFYSNAAATTQAGMNVPNGLAFDDANNRLFVTQTTGNRVTVYDVASITDGENAVNVLGQATFTATTAATTQAGMNVPYDAAYDSANQRLFVSEGTGNRVKVYDVAAITDGENAVNVLGQATFTATTAATTQAGMNAPRGLAYDSANTRLYVAQATGNRVTTYDVAAITDGENAVNVLGQATFTATTAASTQAGMNAPMGIAFDGTNSRLFVAQTTGNRVTMYDVAAITDGENATGVFGQQNYTASTAAVTRNGLSAPNGVLADPAHNRLYVLDGTANRMVTYNLTTTIANGMNATNVLGQATFTATTAANTQAGMNGPRGLAYDSTNQRLFVSHATSNRVTTYDVTAITDGENATNVIGQADFVSAGAATTQAGINTPAGITYASDILYVTQTTGNRVTMYDVASITNGESAINVLGQPTFTVATASTRQAGLNAPNGVLVDTDNNLLYVLQSGAHRVSIFDTTSIIDGENAVDLLGQFSNDTNPPSPIYVKGTANNAAYKLGLSGPQGVAIDSTNHRLFVADSANNRVLMYNLSTGNAVDDRFPDAVLGQANFWANAVATTQNRLSSPTGLAFDSAHNRLYVSDLTNNRIVFYDTASITDGENAIGVLGQPSFLVATAATTQLGLSGVRLLYHDTASDQLFVADATNNRILIYGDPIQSQSAPAGGGDMFHFFGF
jgi:DNA-binding beta-propeller fold protein YncE